jgi:hypothetical protein
MEGGVTMHACKDIKDLITKYLENEMENDERISFEKHIDSCESCKEELEDIKSMINLCSEIEDEELPEDFSSRLHDKLILEKEIQDKSKKLIYNNKYFRIAVSIAAMFLIVLLVKDVQFSKFHSMILSFTDKDNDVMSNNIDSDYKDEKENLNIDTDNSNNNNTNNNVDNQDTEEAVNTDSYTDSVESGTVSPSPSATSSPVIATSEEDDTIEIPESTSKIVINTNSTSDAENTIKSILNKDDIEYESDSTTNIYLKLTFKYENRKYTDFMEKIEENFTNINILENNIDSDLMMIEALEEEISYLEEQKSYDSQDEESYEILISEAQSDIDSIKNTIYYTSVEINIK